MGPKDWASIPSGRPHRAHNKLIQHMQYTYRQWHDTDTDNYMGEHKHAPVVAQPANIMLANNTQLVQQKYKNYDMYVELEN